MFKNPRYNHLNGLECALSEVGNTKLGHVNLGELWNRVRQTNRHPIIQKLVESALLEVVAFPSVVHSVDLIMECISRYNLDTREVKTQDERSLITLDRETI